MKEIPKINFKEIPNPHYRQKGSYTLSINKSGRFDLHSGFVRKENLQEYKYVRLFYDEKLNVIGLKFTKNYSESAYGISINSRGTNAAICCGNFFYLADIDTKKYRGSYQIMIWDERKKEKMFYIDLCKTKPFRIYRNKKA